MEQYSTLCCSKQTAPSAFKITDSMGWRYYNAVVITGIMILKFNQYSLIVHDLKVIARGEWLNEQISM